MSDETQPGSGRTATRRPLWTRIVRHKGNIGPAGMAFLLVLGGAPLIMAVARILALPGADAMTFIGADSLREIGHGLNQWLSLAWVPASDRPAILYLLLLPLGALLVVIARLTFGLRVLGLRAILIAIGFQESGILPSLILMAIVIGTIVAVRPSMRRIRLPLFARISVILCLAALIMVGALLIAPWVRSEAVWSVAFFPVIIVAMLAEGIARTIANDNAVSAAWRAIWTILLSILIAVVGQIPAVGEIAIRFPELMLTQLVAIVLIAEYLDLRLLEHWPDRLHRLLNGIRPWRSEQPRVAVVRNRWNTGVIGRLSRPAPEKYRKRSVQRLLDGLRGLGYEVRVFEGDIDLLRELKSFLAPNPRSGAPGGVVLNLATGTQGNGRFSQVPGMLELAGIAYSGPDPLAQARLADRFAMMSLLRQSNVPVPRFEAMLDVGPSLEPPFPLCVRPRCEPDGTRKTVTDAATLERAIDRVWHRYGQEAMVEEVIAGREFRVALLGNADLECLPLLEQKKRDRVCPAEIETALAERVYKCAIAAFRVLGCRDYARVDVRVAADGQTRVVDVRWVDVLARRGSFMQAAAAAGYDLRTLAGRIVEETAIRYEAPAIEPFAATAANPRAVVSLVERQAAAKPAPGAQDRPRS